MKLGSIVCLTSLITAQLICNVVALILIYRKRRKALKDVTIALLCMINIFLAIPYSQELYANIHEVISESVCIFNAFLICCLSYTSIGYYVELGLESCIEISNPSTGGHVNDISSIIWLLVPPLVGFTLAVPPMLGWGKYGKTREESLYCSFDFIAINNGFSERSYFKVVCFVMVVLPVLIMSHCIFRIVKNLNKKSSTTTTDINHLQGATKSFLFSAIVHFLSWAPYAIFCLFLYCEHDIPAAFEYVAMYLFKSASVTTPIIYCFIEVHIRDAEKFDEERLMVVDRHRSRQSSQSSVESTMTAVTLLRGGRTGNELTDV